MLCAVRLMGRVAKQRRGRIFHSGPPLVSRVPQAYFVAEPTLNWITGRRSPMETPELVVFWGAAPEGARWPELKSDLAVDTEVAPPSLRVAVAGS